MKRSVLLALVLVAILPAVARAEGDTEPAPAPDQPCDCTVYCEKESPFATHNFAGSYRCTWDGSSYVATAASVSTMQTQCRNANVPGAPFEYKAANCYQ